MPFIGISAGHQNIETNCDSLLRPETGAKGEMEFNIRVRDVLSDILQAYGFSVQLDDANGNCSNNTTGKDFDFYLAIHAEGSPPGGAISAPDPSVDSANTESKRICNALIASYFPDTGIENNPAIITNNMTFYYMWNVLTAKTPCGIIECGDLGDPHDSVILNDTRRVALGIAHGLCVAFNIPWKGDPNTPQPIPPDPCADIKKEFEAYKQSHPAIVVTTYPTTNGTIPFGMPTATTTIVTPTPQAKQWFLKRFLQWLLS